MSMLNPFIADYMRTYRYHKRLTCNQVAAKMRVCENTVIGLEQQRVQYKLNHLESACAAFGLLVSTVIEFAEIAEQNGLDAAYQSEAPYLLDSRRNYRESKDGK